jgi:ribosomal protein S18 acetylase RimI-like enzyme
MQNGKSVQMKIRPARRSDLEQIVAIHVESWRDAYSDVLPAEFLDRQIYRVLDEHWRDITIRKEDLVLVAENNSVVGFIAVWCSPDPFIDNLHVTVPERSRKVGSALMKAAAQKLIGRGHRTAFLWVFKSNKKAIRFYEGLGGVRKEVAMKSVFGYEVLSRKIVWVDLAAIR